MARTGGTLVRIVLGLTLVSAPVLLVEGLVHAGVLTRACLSAAGALAGYLVFARLVERRHAHELAPGGLAQLALGLLLGGALFLLVIGSIWALGGVEFAGWAHAPDLRYAAANAVAAGVIEELAARGVVFRLLQRAWGSWSALAVSALLFGALHLMNPGAGPWTALAIALEAGVLLGAAFMATGRLWLPIGLHVGWNFTQGGVFGLAVSGQATGGLLDSRPVGADWISGGAFGAEASVLAVLWCGALGVALLVLAARRGRIVARG